MGLEAPIKAGTYSYYIDMKKVDETDTENYNFNISGVLTGPNFLIHVGNKNEILDLKLNRGSKLKIQKLQQKLIDIEKKLNLEND